MSLRQVNRAGWSKWLGLCMCVCVGLELGCARPSDTGGGKPDPASRPNVIMILVDTLRADRVGCCGSSADLTPVMNEIAAEGAVFTRCITQAPWTQPAVASVFTSRYPSVHRVLAYDRLHRDKYKPKTAKLSATLTTLAELLKEAGYDTIAILANPFIRKKYGFAQGFDHFEEILIKPYTPGRRINQAAAARLKNRQPDKPFFLYLHYMDVHGPYNAPKSVMEPLIDAVEKMPNKRPMNDAGMKNLRYLLRQAEFHGEKDRHQKLIRYPQYWRARYDAGVRDMDLQLGELRSQLQAMGLWDDAYVIILADHGEQLYEHGDWDHGRTVHDYEVRVPLILRWPDHISADLRITQTVQLIDLLPTLMDQLDVTLPGGEQGRSLVPLLDGDPGWQPMAAFAEDVKVGDERQAVYWGDLKLIHTPATGEDAFYAFREDPSELNRLTSLKSDVTSKLKSLRAQWVEKNQELGDRIESEAVPLTPGEQNRLRDIGYTN